MADLHAVVASAAMLAVAVMAAAMLGLVIGAWGAGEAMPSRPFPAYFIFGDSLVDAGNNNYITTIATASNLPFGIDFPQGPTGRFTNGKTVTDVLCERLSLPFRPPYLAPTTRGSVILQGVNYASAAAGIIRTTGYDFIGRVDFDIQLTWFTNTVREISQQLGQNGAQELLKKSFFSITFGANDYVNDYLLKGSPSALQYNTVQFQQLLVNKFTKQLKELYNLGARTVAVTSVGPIGCIPAILARRSKQGECDASVNKLATDFNSDLKKLLAQLSNELPGSNFVYAEAFDPFFNYRSNPQKYGFEYGANACCGAGRFNGKVLCLPLLKPCSDRADYVFWDCYHPTQAANELFGNFLFDTLKDQLFKLV